MAGVLFRNRGRGTKWGAQGVKVCLLGLVLCLGFLSFSGGLDSAEAALLLAPWPAPGGNSWSYAGTIGIPGGLDNIYSGFDSSAYNTLLFAIGSYSPWPTFLPDGPILSMEDGVIDTMSFNASASSLSDGVAIWMGNTVLWYNTNLATASTVVDTRFTLTVTDMSDVAVPLTPASAVTDMPLAAGAVLVVTSSFKGNWLAEAKFQADSSYAPVYNFFDNLHAIPGLSTEVQINIGGGFYYNPVPPDIIVTSFSQTTAEDGTTDTITVSLQTQPANTVTVPVSSDDTTEGDVDKSSLVFTPSDWSIAQTITVTGIDDPDEDGDQNYNIVLGVAVSNDAGYDGLNPDDVAMVNLDNDAPSSGGGGGGGCNTAGPAPGDPLWPDVFWIALLTAIFFLRRRINIRP